MLRFFAGYVTAARDTAPGGFIGQVCEYLFKLRPRVLRIWVGWPECLLEHPKGELQEWASGGILALVRQQQRQVVQAGGSFGMLRPERLLTNGEGDTRDGYYGPLLGPSPIILCT